jgi:beta-glucanase (GH16 family)
MSEISEYVVDQDKPRSTEQIKIDEYDRLVELSLVPQSESYNGKKNSNRIKRLLAVGALMLTGTVFASEKYGVELKSAENVGLHEVISLETLPSKILATGPNSHRVYVEQGPIESVTDSAIIPNSHFINSNPLFSSTPSFLENFTKMKNGGINPKIWNIDIGNGVNGWGNQEAEYYTNRLTNVRLQGGSLVIQANKESFKKYDYTSARINTENKKSFKYGRIDISAKFPAGASTWPAIWMLSASNEYVKLSPPTDPKGYLNSGEIDIAESIGEQPGYISGVAHVRGSTGLSGTFFSRNYTHKFNTYTLEWTPTSLTYMIDGKPFYEYKKPANATYQEWPFDKPFYLVINDAIRGAWTNHDGKITYGPVDNAMFNPKNGEGPLMEIQSIAYYPYIGVRPTKSEILSLNRTEAIVNPNITRNMQGYVSNKKP